MEDLQNFTFGLTILELLRDVSSRLIRALNSCQADADGDTIMADAANDDLASEDENEDEYPDGSDYYEVDDPIFGLESTSNQKSNPPRVGAKMAPGVLNKIRRDLCKARDAGTKIGILHGVEKAAQSHMISLSIRARKLGISDEALEAWDIDSLDYIVLLFLINEPYPSAEKLVEHAASSFHVDFRFGKCKKSKPSGESVRKAFDTQSLRNSADNQDARAQASCTSADSHPFSKLFISNSMEQFMNEHFLALTKLRLLGHQSWDDANLHILQLLIQHTTEGTARLSDPSHDVKGRDDSRGRRKGKGKEVASSDSFAFSSTDVPERQTLPTILTWDSFAESTTDISTPLVAMQFALHYFVRCTEYCLRCHRKVNKEFEALKPYVCEDPLCLFQYITMGFGPSIEHEILSQPYVVDLLVTLCYSSIQEQFNNQGMYPIRDFPAGLRLKVASMPPLLRQVPHRQPVGMQSQPNTEAQDDTELRGKPVKVLVDFDAQTMSVEDPEDIRHLNGKSWVVLRHMVLNVNGYMTGAQDLVHQAYLKYVDRLTNRIDFEIKHQDVSSPSFIRPGAGPQTVELYNYDSELDDLDNAGKARAMTAVLTTIPPISHLREYLMRHPHSRLKSYQGISSSAVTLLEWIVASNRSFILQVNQLNDLHSQDRDLLGMIKTRDQESIPSLTQGYVQFRFAMGNPDKELRFQRALKGLKTQNTPYPTLFAWHGSAINNWHSILRHGLDFKKIANGRAYGDGVYFSPLWTTSQVCASNFPHRQILTDAIWPEDQAEVDIDELLTLATFSITCNRAPRAGRIQL